MSLLDDLREVANLIPASHMPSPQEVSGVVGAVVMALEHGVKSVQVALDNPNDIAEVLTTGKVEPKEQPASGDPNVTVDEKDAQIAALQQQVQTLLANQNKTQVG